MSVLPNSKMKRLTSIFLALFFSLALVIQGWAALSFTLTDSAADNVDRNAYTVPVSGSFTPVSGALYYLFLHNTKGAASVDTPTVTGTNGWSVTWTQEATSPYDLVSGTNRKRVTLFSAVASSAIAGVLTVDFAGATQNSIGWSLIKVSGNAASGYTVQVKIGEITSVGTALTITLDNAFSNSGNENLSGIGKTDDTATNPGTGFAEISDLTWINPSAALETNNLANDTSCDWTWTGNAKAGGISVEVAIAVVGGCAGSRLALTGVGAGC